MNAQQVASNKNFQAIAAVKLLAEKGGFDSLELMKQFVGGKNEELTKRVAEMVAFAAKETAAAL